MKSNWNRLGILITTAAALLMPGLALAQDSLNLLVNEIHAEPIEGEAAYTVTAYVTALDSAGQPVSDLPADSFSVSLDGEAVDLDSAELIQRPGAFVLVIDTSGSMAFQGKMEAVKTAAASFLDQLNADDQVAVIFFNDQVQVAQQEFTSDKQAAKTIVGLLESVEGGGTCLYDAAYTGVTLASSAPEGRRAVVLLTDGIDELPDQSGPCSSHSVDELLSLASDPSLHVPIYTIGVGTRVNSEELANIARQTSGSALLSPDTEGVAGMFNTLAAQLKSQYTLVFKSTTTSGEHTLTLTASNGGATATTAVPFIVPALPPMLSLTGLDQNALLESTKTVRATISGSASVESVTFVLDGGEPQVDTSDPFQIDLNAADLGVGRHQLDVTAKLAAGDELKQSLGFEVQAVIPIAGGPLGFLGTLPEWATVTLIGGLIIVVVVLGVVMLRRKPQVQYIGENRLPGAGIALNVDAYGTLTVLESLSLKRSQTFELAGDLVKLGRGADSTIVVPDAPVSRNQAEIRKADGEIRVFDMGSSYGTFVNDKKVGDAGLILNEGDILKLGTRTAMVFNAVVTQAAGMDDRTMDILPGGAPQDDMGQTIPASPDEMSDPAATMRAESLFPEGSDKATRQGKMKIVDPSQDETMRSGSTPAQEGDSDSQEDSDEDTQPVIR